MPLAGTFDVLDFDEVLTLLSKRAATGRLQLRTGSMHGVVWLAEGRATAAEIGTTSGGDTRTKWRSQLEEICFDALRSPRGSFEFHPEDEVSVPAGPRVRLETLLANARRRLEIWRDVESVIHSFEAVPRMADALTDEAVTVSQDRWKVLVAVDGRRNVAALAKRLDIELLEFCQLLKPLIESGAIVLDQPDGWLKSLPKVRLEVAGGADIDPATVVDPGGPEDSLAVLNVNSTPVQAPGNGNGNGAHVSAGPAPAGATEAPAQPGRGDDADRAAEGRLAAERTGSSLPRVDSAIPPAEPAAAPRRRFRGRNRSAESHS